MKCVNENCDRDPMKTGTEIAVTIDGDFACCPECVSEYEKQRDHFFTHTIQSKERTERYLKGE